MQSLWQDIRFGMRILRRNPGLTLAAVLSLALGIGANTTIFSVLSAVFLQPVPGEDPSTLVAVYRTFEDEAGGGGNLITTSYPNFLDFEEQATSSFSGLAAFTYGQFNLAGEKEPELVNGIFATANYFDVLGLVPQSGRFFLPEEDLTPGTHPVVVLSDALWQRRFGADPDLVGETVRLHGRSFTVVGIAPAGFRGTAFLGGVDLWVPTMMYPALRPGEDGQALEHRGFRFFSILGRLRPEVGVAAAEAELDAVAERLAEAHPRWNRQRGAAALPLAEAIIPPFARPLFVRAGAILSTAVALVLAIACANVANLLLARSRSRSREIAMRLSLGAARLRVARQLLTESALLAIGGGALGWLLALWSQPLLQDLLPPFLTAQGFEFGLDMKVLAFTAGITLVAAFLFGLAPAVQTGRTDLMSALKTSGANTASAGGKGFTMPTLVTAQVALSLVALAAAGLFLSSLYNAYRIDPGFEHENMLAVDFDASAEGLDATTGPLFYRRLLESVEALPGVRSASLSDAAPLSGVASRRTFIDGAEEIVGPEGTYISVDSVSPDHFANLGLALVEGRFFSGTERDDTHPVVVVNQTMAQRFWPEGSAIGGLLRWPDREQPLEVVGVVADMKYTSLGEDPQPYIYRPLAQRFVPSMTLWVHTAGSPADVLPVVRQELRRLAPDLPLTDAEPVAEAIERSLWAASMAAGLLAIFGTIALVLAATGVYAVVAQALVQRRREVGIRIALGARPASVVRLLLKQGLAPVLIGSALGLGLAFAAGRQAADLLFGSSGTEPPVFLATAATLWLVALLACMIPALKATRVDPVRTLRAE